MNLSDYNNEDLDKQKKKQNLSSLSTDVNPNQQFLDAGHRMVEEKIKNSPLFRPERYFEDMTDDDYIAMGRDNLKESSQRTLGGTLKDIAITGAKGVVGVGESVVGLADIPTFGYVGKGMEEYLGYDPEKTQKMLYEQYSPAQKEAFENVNQAKGFIPTIKESIKNPSTIGHAILESAPQMLGGAAAAKKIISSGVLKMTPTWSKIISSAMGEGLVSAGASAENVRQQTEDGLLTPKQAAISVASGIGTGLFSVVGGRVAEKFGFADPDTFLAGGSNVTKTGIIKRIFGGGISEGAFEELPQSMQEQVWLNAALDKPLLDGVGEAGATGLLSGMAMGAGFNVFTGESSTNTGEPSIEDGKNKQIDVQAEKIISNGPEVINNSLIQIDKNLTDFNNLLNDPELLEAKAVELDIPIEELTASLNDQINTSMQLQERLMAEITPSEPELTNQEIIPPEEVIPEDIPSEDMLQSNKFVSRGQPSTVEESAKSFGLYPSQAPAADSAMLFEKEGDTISNAQKERQRIIDKTYLPAEQELDALDRQEREKNDINQDQLKELSIDQNDRRQAEIEVDQEKRIAEPRRIDTTRRKHIDEMTIDEMRTELKTSHLTGLGNKRAYEESVKKPIQVSIDVDSLKWTNDNFGHESGDELLKVIGRAFEGNSDAFHVSGDEFLFQSDTQENVDNAIQKANNYLDKNPIDFVDENGNIISQLNGSFSYGTGKTATEADIALRRSKTDREISGDRAARGEKPTGFKEIIPERETGTETITGQNGESSTFIDEQQVEPLINQNDSEIAKDPNFELRQDQTPDQGVQVKDIQKIFPGQNVFINDKKQISVKLKNGKGIIFENIKNVGNDFIEYAVQTGQISKNDKILGVTLGNKILLDSEFADNKTLWHENKHALDNLDIITKEDNSALNKEFNKLRKLDKLQFELSTHEDSIQRMNENRANMFAQIMTSREEYRNTTFGKLIQKVMDFFNQLYMMGHRVVTGNQEFQTISGLARETESGKLYERTINGKSVQTFTPQLEVPAKQWYSALEKGIENIKQKIAPAGQWKGMINKIPGIKQDELEWLGLDEWFDNQEGKINKEDLLNFIQENNIQIEEFIKGEPISDSLRNDLIAQRRVYWDKIQQKIDLAKIDAILGIREGQLFFYDTLGHDVDFEGSFPVLYNDIKNDLQEAQNLANQIRVPFTKYPEYTIPEGKNYKELLLTLPKKSPNYKSLHWNESNVLAHVRFNEHTGPNGEKVLFLEEIQSDWISDIRKKGVQAKKYKFEESKLPPNVPWQKTYPLKTMQRMVRYAAENGFDQIAWTPGKIQTERYGTENFVWYHENDELKLIGRENTNIENSKQIAASIPNKQALREQIEDLLTEKEDEYSKDNWNKYIDRLTNTIWDKIQQGEDIGSYQPRFEGMNKFYDKILPNETNKFFSKAKWGKAKVDKSIIEDQEVHVLKITDKMRDKALREGMPQFTYAGQQASNADKSMLNKAIELEQTGIDNESIRKETGWFLGMDDKWRFEIDDRKAEWNINGLVTQLKSKFNIPLTLKNVFKHPELYKAYPELKNINFELKELPKGVKASHNSKTNKIELNSVWIDRLEKEGNVQDATKRTIVHELQHAIQRIEGFAKGGKPTLKNTDIGADLTQKLNSFKELMLKQPDQRTEKETETYFWLKKNMPKLKKLVSEKAYEQYRRLAGEIEARDVSARMDWNKKDREKITPYETQGISKEDAIVQFNKDVSLEMQEPLAEQKISDEQYLKRHQEKESILKKIQKSTRMKASEVKLMLDKSLTPISTRLKNIGLDELSAKLQMLDFKTSWQITEVLKEAHPMMIKAKKMSPIDRTAWDSARKNSEISKITQLAQKYDIEDNYNNVRKILDQIRQDAIGVGFDVGFVEDYWPRVLKDIEGFLQATQKISRRPIFTDAIKAKADKLGITITELGQKYPDLKADIISNTILGNYSGIGGPGNIQGRVFETIPEEYAKFYMNSDAALMQYIYSMTKKIEARKFFGKVSQQMTKIKQRRNLAQTEVSKLEKLRDLTYNDGLINEDKQKLIESHNKRIDLLQENIKDYDINLEKYKNQQDYTENIGTYINDLMLSGKLHKKDEQTVRDILDARFHEKGTTGIVHKYKNISYIDVMGNPMAAVTQIGDIAWAMYVGQIWNPLRLPSNIKNLTKAIFKKSNISKEALGIDRMAQEFADSDSLSNLVSKVFKGVGLERIDSIGKEFLINNTFDAYKNQASSKNGRIELMKKLKPIFGNSSDKVINELLALSKDSTANPSENIKMLLYSRLLDFQPVALSEMPENYLKGGNWRILYMLKTFTIKQFDVFRNEVWKDLKTGNTQQKLSSMKRMVQLMGVLALANAGADEIKDFMMGKETKFSDTIIENFLTMGGANRFVRMQARREGIGTTIGQMILPPFKFIDSLSKDVFSGEIADIEKSRTLESLPFVGKLAYWHIGRGSEYKPSIEKQDFNKAGKGFRKFKKDLEETNDKRLFLQTNADEFKQMKIYENFSKPLKRITTLINKLEKIEQTTNVKKRIGQLTEGQNQLMQRYFDIIKNKDVL